eukprot:5021029-Ditylum_brightwellii.AAC.1
MNPVAFMVGTSLWVSLVRHPVMAHHEVQAGVWDSGADGRVKYNTMSLPNLYSVHYFKSTRIGGKLTQLNLASPDVD